MTPETANAIETNGLTKKFGDVIALDGIDLLVENGEVFGFLGPNGAGKTTTIDLLLDFIRPTSGSASVLGFDTQEEPEAVRERVGILPDGFELWERLTGYQHLEFAIDSKGDQEDPDRLLNRTGLDPIDAERPVSDYSKGMLQRLGMAMALVGDPELLILDEPSAGLDPHGIRRMQTLIREEAAAGTTVFFSSHILGQVSAVCDRVGILDAGELVAVDTVNGLHEAAAVESQLVVDVDYIPPVDLSSVAGVTDVVKYDGRLEVGYATSRAKAPVVHELVEAGATVYDFEVREPTLEVLFAAYTDSPEYEKATADGESHSRATDTTGGNST